METTGTATTSGLFSIDGRSVDFARRQAGRALSERRSYRVDALAERLGGELFGDGSVEVRGVGSLSEAGPEELSLYSDPRYRAELARTRAGALLTSERLEKPSIPQIILPDPFLALMQLVDLFHPPAAPDGSVHSLASVAESARLAEGATVHAFACVGPDVELGRNTVVHPGAYIGAGTVVGESSVVWPNAVIRERCRLGHRVIVHPGAVIGADGFGFARREGAFIKLRHVGTVVIEDDVEIGANATIDRGTLGKTWIRRGVKIDNLVHIAHNVEIGEDSAMAAQTGISGSTVVGRRVLMGGQVGLVDHLRVGDDAILVAQSGVIGNVPSGAMVSGYPARSHREVLKSTVALRGLDRLKAKIRSLEEKVRALEKASDDP